MIDSKIAKRLKQARINSSYDNVVDMVRDFGWNINTYRSHEGGIRGIPATRLETYARAFNVSIDWLQTGRGEKSGIGKTVPLQPLPVHGRVQAGSFVEAMPDFSGREIPMAVDPDYSDYEQYALEVKGDSMNMHYPSGSFVHCAHIEYHPDDIMPEHGDHVIVERRKGDLREVTVKEFVFTKSGAELWPRSSNPEWQSPINLTDDTPVDEVQITALVIGCYIKRRRKP
jgi:SOS-response transcriptional repressor LexA